MGPGVTMWDEINNRRPPGVNLALVGKEGGKPQVPSAGGFVPYEQYMSEDVADEGSIELPGERDTRCCVLVVSEPPYAEGFGDTKHPRVMASDVALFHRL